ncbi:MAG: hypothetical protein AAF236_16085 [Verrucomicrobiota bacterium]
MKPLLVSLLACLWSSTLLSDPGSFEPSRLDAPTQPASNGFVIVPADSMTAEIDIVSSADTQEAQIQDLIAARDQLKEKLTAIDTLFEFHDTVPTFREVENVAGQWEPSANSITVEAVYGLPEDPLALVERVAAVVREIEATEPERFKLKMRSMRRTLVSAETNRQPIITKILGEIQYLDELDSEQFIVKLEGFEKPLTVAPYGVGQFVVSLPYTLTIESSTSQRGTDAGVLVD